MQAMIEAVGLCKAYRVPQRRSGLFGGLLSLFDPHMRLVEAVQSLDLYVERGEMIGLVGPNGAGKSTTIKMLTGILQPSGGSVSVAGVLPLQQRRELAAHMGAVFGQRTQLWWDLPLIDSLQLLQHLYRVPDARFNANLARLRLMLDLDEFINTPVRQLSLGQRMRGDLAAALLHDPDLLFLDEPTIGLDVVAKASIREFLRDLNKETGTTVVLTTHDMDDVEALCPRIVIIDKGRKLFDGKINEIRQQFGSERVMIAQIDDTAIASLPRDETGAVAFRDIPEGVSLVRIEGPRIWFSFAPDRVTAPSLVAWLDSRFTLCDVTFQDTEIEDIIRRIYTEGLLLADEQGVSS
jgi:ABC-2 type transport system ATP-binding protein